MHSVLTSRHHDHCAVREGMFGCRATASHGTFLSSITLPPRTNHEESTSDPISSSNMRPGSTTSTGARPEEAASSHCHSVTASTITCRCNDMILYPTQAARRDERRSSPGYRGYNRCESAGSEMRKNEKEEMVRSELEIPDQICQCHQYPPCSLHIHSGVTHQRKLQRPYPSSPDFDADRLFLRRARGWDINVHPVPPAFSLSRISH